MTCSGVRAGPSGTATSKTAPVSAIRLQPFFSPVRPASRRSAPAAVRAPGPAAARVGEHRHALTVRRERQRRQARPRPPGRRDGGGLVPAPVLAEPLASAAAAATICSSCRLPTLTPVAASTNSCPCSYDTDRRISPPAAATARNTPAAASSSRDSPQTVETSVVVIMASMAGLLAPASGRGRLVACPLFLLPGAAVVSGVKGGPQGPSPAGRCGAPLRPEGRPRTLSGRKKASGGAAASFARPAQRARRAHAASFPARDRS